MTSVLPIAIKDLLQYCFFFPTYVHVDAINSYESQQLVADCYNTTSDYKTLCTGGIFATYPKPFLTLGTGFFDQVCQYLDCFPIFPLLYQSVYSIILMSI